MKLHKGFNLLFSIFAIVITKVLAIESRTRVIVVHSDSLNPFRHNINRAAANIELLMHENKLKFLAADLSTREIKYLRKGALGKDGLIVNNNVFLLDDTVGATPLKSSNTEALANSPYLSNTPHCTTPLNNVDFVILDTLMFNNVTELSNTTITYGPNFTNDTIPCNPHATQIASVVVGKTVGVIPYGNRTIHNIAAFDCFGRAFPEQIIKAFSAAVNFSRNNEKNGRRTVISFSGIGGNNIAITLAAETVVLAGVPLFISAGNSGVNLCDQHSTAIVDNVFIVGSTSYPGNQPTNFTNFGNKCVELFLPGENINVAVVGSSAPTVDGTSFSAPIAAALGGMELGLDLKATPSEIFTRISARPRTVQVIPKAPANFFEPIKVMLDQYVCPSETRIFNNLVTVGRNRPVFSEWHKASAENQFCITFNVKAVDAAIVLLLRNNATSHNIVRIKIGNNNLRHHKNNSIRHNGIQLDTSINRPNLLEKNTKAIFTIQSDGHKVSVMHEKADGVKKLLLFANVSQHINEVAFGSIAGAANYKNGLKCKI